MACRMFIIGEVEPGHEEGGIYSDPITGQFRELLSLMNDMRAVYEDKMSNTSRRQPRTYL